MPKATDIDIAITASIISRDVHLYQLHYMGEKAPIAVLHGLVMPYRVFVALMARFLGSGDLPNRWDSIAPRGYEDISKAIKLYVKDHLPSPPSLEGIIELFANNDIEIMDEVHTTDWSLFKGATDYVPGGASRPPDNLKKAL